MSWSNSGKYWNVGLSEPGRLAATPRQLWSLHLLSGRKIDYRGKGLTRDQASDLISKMRKEKEQSQRDLVVRSAFFEAAFDKAIKAANDAGDRWFKNHSKPLYEIYEPDSGERVPIHGPLGEVVILWPKDSIFSRWAKQHAFNGQYSYLYVPHKYHGRPEYELQKVTTEAAYKALSDVVPGLKIRSQEFWS